MPGLSSVESYGSRCQLNELMKYHTCTPDWTANGANLKVTMVTLPYMVLYPAINIKPICPRVIYIYCLIGLYSGTSVTMVLVTLYYMALYW